MADQIDCGITGRFPYASDKIDEETRPLVRTLSSSQRPRNFRLCYDDHGDDGDHREWSKADINDSTSKPGLSNPEPWGVAHIDFLYSIETDRAPSSLAPRVTYTIVSSVSSAIIESIYRNDCSQRHRRRRRRSLQAISDSSLSSGLRSRRMEILSISPGDGHEWVGECETNASTTGSNNGSGSSFCNKVEGTVVIGFDEKNSPGTMIGAGTSASDFKSVGDIVLSRIQEDMINGKYLDRVNRDVLDFGVTITNMKYIDSDYHSLVDENAFAPVSALSGSIEGDFAVTNSTEMSLFSKVAIPLMVVLSITAFVLCWCAIVSWPTDLFRQKNPSKQNARGSAEGEDGNLYRNKYPEERAEAHHDSGRYHRDQISHNDDSPPATITIRARHSSNNADGNKNDDELLDCKSILRTPSLEATLQDLSETEVLKYGHQGATRPMEKRNRETYSTIPIDNRTGVHRFLPMSIRARNQSMIHVTDGSSHPSDTETGSTPSDETNNYDGRDHSKVTSDIDLGKMGDRGSVVGTSISMKSPSKSFSQTRSSSRGFISSYFSKRNMFSRTTTPVISLVDRVNECTSTGNNPCFGEERELPPPTKNSDNSRPDKSTEWRYVVPNDGNSLTEVKNSDEDTATLRSSRISPKKAAAYRAYINKKTLRHTEECENDDDLSIPMEIGVKRTFTDDRGRIRDMVAL